MDETTKKSSKAKKETANADTDKPTVPAAETPAAPKKPGRKFKDTSVPLKLKLELDISVDVKPGQFQNRGEVLAHYNALNIDKEFIIACLDTATNAEARFVLNYPKADKGE